MKNKIFAACIAVLGLVSVVACGAVVVRFLGLPGLLVGACLLLAWFVPESCRE